MGPPILSGTSLDARPAKLKVADNPKHQFPDVLLCPGIDSDGTPCTKPGKAACSQCLLVKYCGRDHQNSHWRTHKVDCKSPYLSKTWKPRWAAEGRQPTFVGNNQPAMTAFGADRPRYLWGNVPAIDFLRVAHNEGIDASEHKNFDLAFVASGDLRNVVATVNGLPQNYTGRCRILVNDIDPVIVYRNALILLTLLRDHPGRCTEAAVDSALHLWYSAALPPAASTEFYACTSILFEEPASTVSHFETIGKGQITFHPNPAEHDKMAATYASTFNTTDALKKMRSVSLAPSRQDYLDRHIGLLSPPHRAGFMKQRQSGVLSPFSQDVSKTFTQPNRTLFSESGAWLLMDSANPLWGWDVATVLQSGQRHGVDKNDVYGCLFFHVKEQLTEFARRCAGFHIQFHLRNIDALDIPRCLATDSKNSTFGKLFTGFDRIETSNIMDYMFGGPSQLIYTFASLLNTRNASSTLCMSTINWLLRYYGSSSAFSAVKAKRIASEGPSAMKILDMSPEKLRKMDPVLLTASFMAAADILHDDSAELSQFLEGEMWTAKTSLRLRARNRIHTRRIGIPIEKQWSQQLDLSPEEYYNLYVLGGCDAPLRFLEFEPSLSK